MNQTSQRYSISASDLSLGQLAIIFPIFHLLMSTIYVWAYCVGFGLNLALFTTTSDIFTFAISSMIPIYLISFIVPIIYTAIRYSQPQPFAQDIVMNIEDNADREIAFNKLKRVRLFIFLCVLCITLGILTSTIVNMMAGRPVSYLSFMFIATFVVIVSFAKAKDMWRVDNLTYEVAFIIASFAIACVVFGLERGQDDRLRRYDIFKDDYFQCGRNLVIRKIGDTFLVIKPDNSRAMVDKDCKELFRADAHHVIREENARQKSAAVPPKAPRAAPQGQGAGLDRP